VWGLQLSVHTSLWFSFNILVQSYFADLSAGHRQQEHETMHGTMSQTGWAIDGSDDGSNDGSDNGSDDGSDYTSVEGRKLSWNDGGVMLCHLACLSLGRHVHFDISRGSDSHNSEAQHVTERISPDPDDAKDSITHALRWRRTGRLVM
jgi:hypothetical protein